jgi:hypothetical protein
MTIVQRPHLPLVGGILLAIVAILVVMADSGILGGERQSILLVDHMGNEGDWRDVRERGRYVSSIHAEKLDLERYVAPFLVEPVKDAAGTLYMLTTGAMVDGSAELFKTIIDEYEGEFDTVAFDTAGFGLIDEGVVIGTLIRERGLKTAVLDGAVCGGIGCLAAFVGGVERTVTDLPYFGGGRFGLVGEAELGGS